MALKINLGIFLTLVILSSSFYFMYDNSETSIKFEFDKYGVTYKVLSDGSYKVVANEFIRLYNGSRWIKNAVERKAYWINDSNVFSAVVDVRYDNNVSYKLVSTFNIFEENIENHPVNTKLDCYNCDGLRVEVWFTGIDYDGESKVISSPFSFDPNMTLEWDDRAYYSKVFNYKTVNDKIFIKFRPEENFESYSIRLFDPPKVKWIYEDVEKKKIKYKVEEVCVESNYSEVNDTWSEAYCYNQTIFDGYDIKIKKVKTNKFTFKNKAYDEKSHYYEEENEIHSFSVPVGDRNWEDNPCTWESNKSVCEVIKVI